MTWDESHPRWRRGGTGRALTCAEVAEVLPSLAGGESGVSRRVRSHVETCLHCQAEVARHRRQRRQLRGLRDQPVEPPPVGRGPTAAGPAAAGPRPGGSALAGGTTGRSVAGRSVGGPSVAGSSTLVDLVLARIDPEWEAHQEARAARRSLVRVGGISAVTVTMAGAGVLVWMSRRRLALAS